MSDLRRNVFPIGFVFCVCLIIAGTTTSCYRTGEKDALSAQKIERRALSSSLSPISPGKRAVVAQAYGRLPLYFIANRGQVNEKAAFYEVGSGHTTFFSRKGIVLSLREVESKDYRIRNEAARPKARPGKSLTRRASDARSSYLSVMMRGMNKDVEIVPEDVQPGRVNYFIGNDPHKWRTNIPTYKAVLYRNAYPGIDIKFYGNNRQLEYDIIVKPGADPSEVKFQYTGAKDIHVTKAGDLAIELNGGRLIQRKPGIYQEIDGRRVLCQGNFKIREDRPPLEDSKALADAEKASGQHRVFNCGFRVASYRRDYPLVIDPVLAWSTYLGGSGGDTADAIAVDSSGNVYVAGDTGSTDFPTQNAFQGTNNSEGQYGSDDAFITKLNPSGNTLVYSTYLGGTGDEQEAYGIAVDSSGNTYVAGRTTSTDFPTKNAFQATNREGQDGTDAFVTKLNPSGSGLVYSTYLGGSDYDKAYAIAVDSSGNAYVTGETSSTDFPTQNAFQATYHGTAQGSTVFITKFNTSGALVYSTYLGGSGGEGEEGAITVDSSGSAYVAGSTASTDFPVTDGAFQSSLRSVSGANAFITKLSPSGGALVYSTYLGGSGGGGAWGIAVDSAGNAYIAGDTSSTDFPTQNAFQDTIHGGQYGEDAFIAKLNPSGSALVYSTYLGGSGEDSPGGIAIDSAGNAYIAGTTSSTDFPTLNAFQATNHGGEYGEDAFIAKLNPSGNALVYSTYLGGSGDEETEYSAIAVDSSGNAYVAGYTLSTDFPVTSGAFQTNLKAVGGNAFVTKISAQTGGLWQNAKDLGSGWKWLNWFGYFNTNSSPWIYHMQHGWLYTFGTSTDNIWFYDPAMGSFWWTSATVYPYVYRASDGAWLYYDVGTSNPRWFFNYSTNKWEKH